MGLVDGRYTAGLHGIRKPKMRILHTIEKDEKRGWGRMTRVTEKTKPVECKHLKDNG